MIGRVLVDGEAEGPVLATSIPLSFWGGVEPASGMIIDAHHPLRGQSLQCRILAMPGGRGSSAASAVLLELIVAENGPCGILLGTGDGLIAIGSVVAEEMFGRSIPVLVLPREYFATAASAATAHIRPGGQVQCHQ